MGKKRGVLLIAAGAVLVILALSLLGNQKQEDVQAGEDASAALSAVQTLIQERQPPTDPPETQPEAPKPVHTPVKQTPRPAPEEETLPPEMPEVKVDGYGYVGYLTIPALELELPVMAQWDYTRLRIAPCRQFGSSRTDDLVIAAHNYDSHFGTLYLLSEGDAVIFTDMDGIVNHYTVARMDKVVPTDVEAVQYSGYDLVLYTCTPGLATRTTIFCNRTPQLP